MGDCWTARIRVRPIHVQRWDDMISDMRAALRLLAAAALLFCLLPFRPALARAPAPGA